MVNIADIHKDFTITQPCSTMVSPNADFNEQSFFPLSGNRTSLALASSFLYCNEAEFVVAQPQNYTRVYQQSGDERVEE